MRRPSVALAFLGLVVALMSSAAVAVAIWPAVWLAPRVATKTGGRVTLADVEGTIWRGSATLMVGALDDRFGTGTLPGRLHWQNRFRFPFGLRVELSDPAVSEAPITVDSQEGVLHVDPFDVHLPLSLLAGLGTPLNTIGLSGRADVRARQWTLAQGRLEGEADVRFENVGSQLSAVRPLGTYRLHLAALGSYTALQLTSEQGPLFLEAQGTIDARGPSVAGAAHAAPEAAERLADLLSVLGRPEGNVIVFHIGARGS